MLDAVGLVGRAAEDVLAGRVVEASAGRDMPSRVGLLVQRQLASAMAYHQPLDATVPNVRQIVIGGRSQECRIGRGLRRWRVRR